MNEQRLLNTFYDLVRIASPSRSEGAVAAYCQSALSEAGWQVEIDDSAKTTGSDTGNLTATLTGTSSATLFFSAHMDTVEPAMGIEPVLENGIIRSVGETILGGDDKVGIAALLEMARVFGESASARASSVALAKPATSATPAEPVSYPTLKIVLSVQEEIGLIGAKAYDLRAMSGHPCFVLDAAGSPGTVVIGAPYQRSFVATVTGLAAHAGVAPEKGISAIEVAAAAIAALPLGRLDEQTTANIGTIQGGAANNIVAESCRFTGECRSQDQERVEQLRQQIEGLIRAEVAKRKATVELTWEDNYEGFSLAPDDPLVVYCQRIAIALGLPADTEISGGGADTNIYAGRGAQALSLGTGMTNIHSTAEYLAEADLYNLTRYIVALIENYC